MRNVGSKLCWPLLQKKVRDVDVVAAGKFFLQTQLDHQTFLVFSRCLRHQRDTMKVCESKMKNVLVIFVLSFLRHPCLWVRDAVPQILKKVYAILTIFTPLRFYNVKTWHRFKTRINVFAQIPSTAPHVEQRLFIFLRLSK